MYYGGGVQFYYGGAVAATTSRERYLLCSLDGISYRVHTHLDECKFTVNDTDAKTYIRIRALMIDFKRAKVAEGSANMTVHPDTRAVEGPTAVSMTDLDCAVK